jgi:hypothetical protein
MTKGRVVWERGQRRRRRRVAFRLLRPLGLAGGIESVAQEERPSFLRGEGGSLAIRLTPHFFSQCRRRTADSSPTKAAIRGVQSGASSERVVDGVLVCGSVARS